MIGGLLVLGIDPSTSCGWALVSHRPAGALDREGNPIPHATSVRVSSGVWQLKGPGKAHEGTRFVRLLDELEVLVERFGKPGLVAVEKPGRFDSDAAAFAVWGIATHVCGWACRLKVPVVMVPITTIKQRATGSGKASKDQIIEYAARVYRCSPATDDEADALVAARLGPKLVDPAAVF